MRFKVWAASVIIIGIVLVCSLLSWKQDEDDAAVARFDAAYHAGLSSTPEPTPKPQDMFSRADYDRVKNGMTYDEVVNIMVVPGNEKSSNTIDFPDGSITTKLYEWQNEGGSVMQITFSNDKVYQKAQSGLKMPDYTPHKRHGHQSLDRPKPLSSQFDLLKFVRLTDGMTYEQVCEAIGEYGAYLSGNDKDDGSGIEWARYEWGYYGLGVTAEFQDNKLVRKEQSGLKYEVK